MTQYTVVSDCYGETVKRKWWADDEDHAREQHEDAFPEESIVRISKPAKHVQY